MNEDDFSQRLAKIEHQIKFLVDAYKQLHNIFIKGVYVNFEKSLLEPSLGKLHYQVQQFERLVHEITQATRQDSILGSIAYMGKRIHMMEMTLESLKENGIKKKIQVDFSVDGYEMVKKKPALPDIVPEMEISPEDVMKRLLNTLTERESLVIIHRYGLFDNKEKTLVATGKVMGITGERVREIQNKALRKMRHPERRNLMDMITHKQLKKDVRGEEE